MKLNPFFRKRQAAYAKVFGGPDGQKVLADLKRFCRATTPTADVNNPNVTYMLEGRREVFLRVISHLQLTEDDVYSLMEDYGDD